MLQNASQKVDQQKDNNYLLNSYHYLYKEP